MAVPECLEFLRHRLDDRFIKHNLVNEEPEPDVLFPNNPYKIICPSDERPKVGEGYESLPSIVDRMS